MDLGLEDSVAVVTGASRGIGLAIAEALADEGARVVAAARTESVELKRLADASKVRTLQVDLTEPDGPARLAAFAGERIDVLVNNVGSAPARPGGFLSVTEDEWQRVIDLNLLAAVRTTRAILPKMIARSSGSIVNICSVNSVLSDPMVIDYSAAKAALASFSKALSKEAGAHGVRVNTVSPGPVATDLWLGSGGVAETIAGVSGASAEAVVQQASQGSVLGRFSQPREIADIVLLLASDRTANITGADVRIDGGLVPTW